MTDVFWDVLSVDDQEAMAAAGTSRAYPTGSVVFHEGERSTFAVVLRRGRLKLTTSSPEGRELLIELRGENELIGELGVIDDAPRSASAIAVERVEALTIPAAAFNDLLVERGSISVAVLRLTASRLRQSGLRRLESGTSDVLVRLSRRLVELVGDTAPRTDGVIEVMSPLTQQEMAEWIGVSRDAVVLALRQLRENGAIETGRRQIRIHDFELLKKIAEG
ncbi:MAG: Crp/Fnr family transcriptional regulator [Actinomycetota bacterium]